MGARPAGGGSMLDVCGTPPPQPPRFAWHSFGVWFCPAQQKLRRAPPGPSSPPAGLIPALMGGRIGAAPPAGGRLAGWVRAGGSRVGGGGGARAQEPSEASRSPPPQKKCFFLFPTQLTGATGGRRWSGRPGWPSAWRWQPLWWDGGGVCGLGGGGARGGGEGRRKKQTVRNCFPIAAPPPPPPSLLFHCSHLNATAGRHSPARPHLTDRLCRSAPQAGRAVARVRAKACP